MSNLYIIATPIGNMGDITLRAIETLKNVDLILCEDTRMTKRLLDKYSIHKPTMSYHSYSKLSKTNKIIELLEEGKDLAFVSDAGTPGISDPGTMLVSKVKEYFDLGVELPSGSIVSKQEVKVIPIPGASAFVVALSASGIPSHQFTFLGFLPHKKGRETLFKEIALSKRTIVFYESPHRILKTLESLQKYVPNRKVCIARELTKIYEEFKIGSPVELLKYFNENKEKQKGEFVVLISP